MTEVEKEKRQAYNAEANYILKKLALFNFNKRRITGLPQSSYRRAILSKTTRGINDNWFKILTVLGGTLVLGFVILGVVLMWGMPSLKDLKNLRIVQSTVIYDREDNELYSIYGDENRTYVSLGQVSPFLPKAFVAVEDKDFYEHWGFDPVSILRAFLANLRNQTLQQGGSTITQQLARNIFLSPRKSIIRKLKEVILALRLERQYSKAEILELYLNQIPFGSNAYGVQQAALTFFGKQASELNLVQSAVIASLPKAPTYYSPYGQNLRKLMGYCRLADTKEEEGALIFQKGELNFKLIAKDKIWLRVKIDGKDTREFFLQKGEERNLKITDSLEFLLGNLKLEILINNLPTRAVTQRTFEINRQSFKDWLINPLLFKEGLVEGECKDYSDPNYVPGRKDLVLRQMLEEKYITEEEFSQAWRAGRELVFSRNRENIQAPHFVFYVKKILEERYGEELVEKGGLKVRTTLDLRLQKIAEETIANKADFNLANYDANNEALVSVDVQTGEILAMVGSRDYFNDEIEGKVNLVLSKRQPGSSFKPFVYATAFLHGTLSPGSILWDVPTKIGPDEPQNFDEDFLGPLTVRRALDYSRNLPAAKTYFLAGREESILDFMDSIGIKDLREFKNRINEGLPPEKQYNYGWPLALGAGEMTPLRMTEGYAVFASGGLYRAFTPLLEVRDSEGNLLEKYLPEKNTGKRVLDERVAYLINNILADDTARPESWNVSLRLPGRTSAVKTGTSSKRLSKEVNLPLDGWVIGYTPEVITTVWAGNTDGKPMKKGSSGFAVVTHIWHDFMVKALQDRAEVPFVIPEGVVWREVSSLSGKLVSSETPRQFRVNELFASYAVPTEFDDAFSLVKIDKRNRLLANEKCPPGAVEEIPVLKAQSEDPNFPEWVEGIKKWVAEHPEFFQSKRILGALPEEESPLCQNAVLPGQLSLILISPAVFGGVVVGNLEVVPQINSSNGVNKVVYFLDDKLKDTQTTAPYIGQLRIPSRFVVGSSHTIKAVLYDQNFYQTEASMVVKIVAQDNTPPVVKLAHYTSGADFYLGEEVDLLAEARDFQSQIAKVTFSLDGTLIKTLTERPFETRLWLDPQLFSEGTHLLTLEAWDEAGNPSKDEVSLNFIIPLPIHSDEKLVLLSPVTGTNVRLGEVLAVKVFIAQDVLAQTKEIKLIVQATGEGELPIVWQEFTPAEIKSEYLNFFVYPDKIGLFKVYMELEQLNGEKLISATNLIAVK
ncbi:hypothetical protein AUJ78_00640 [Candidatus Peregrinibacteria bacterium CG1_02_41_10]|nr:MAG: hypothetical protein AUJ78_00640 [Candidatus Peregrinibacteria bacterium CG1_02_41_10]